MGIISDLMTFFMCQMFEKQKKMKKRFKKILKLTNQW